MRWIASLEFSVFSRARIRDRGTAATLPSSAGVAHTSSGNSLRRRRSTTFAARASRQTAKLEASSVALMMMMTTLSVASATERPRHRLRYQNFTVVRLNPLGFQNQFELAYRYRLYNRDDLLFRTGYAGVSLNPTVTPALIRLGVKAEVEPIAVLKLGVRWEWIQYYGVLDHLQSFANTDADYSDTAIQAGGDADTNRPQGGWQLTLRGELRAKVGPVVFRNTLKALLTGFDLPSGHRVWYDPYYDALTPGRGWSLVNDADLLVFLFGKRLILGVRHNVTHALFSDESIGSQDVDDTPMQRLGPLIAWRLFDDPGAAWNRPTIVLLVSWYLQHPNRTGRDVDQAIPYAAIGFAFSGDLL